ncbi:unnamed protein product [Polarella glacialis]|nr:unnamed protein product [Polarella glacialis]
MFGNCFRGFQKLADSLGFPLRLEIAESDGIYAKFAYASEDGQTKDACIKHCFVANGRGRAYTLEQHGFALSSLPWHQHVPLGADLYNPAEASQVLYPLAEDVLRREFPSCTKVLIFDHIARNKERYTKETMSGEHSQAFKTPLLASGPAFSVHGDYTVRSGFTRARSLLEPHETEERISDALRQRFAFVNVWVPLEEVHRDPLGLIEWESQRPCDVSNLQFIYKHRVGEIYRVVPSSQHRWAYFPRMIPGECLVVKTFESATDGRARFSLHSAFEDSTAKPEAPARESIELRCIVFFGDLPSDFATSFIAPHLALGSPDQDLGPEEVIASTPGDEW